MKNRNNTRGLDIYNLENRIKIVRTKIDKLENKMGLLRVGVITNIKNSENIENRIKNLNTALYSHKR